MNKSTGGVKGSHISIQKWGKNSHKLNFKVIGWRWWDNGVETAWNSFLIVYIITTASSENIFIKKSKGGVKGALKNKRKWG